MMPRLYNEIPQGGGWLFELTKAGQLVWDGEHGRLERARLVVRIEGRINQLVPHRHPGMAGSVVVQYSAPGVPPFIGVPPSVSHARFLAEEIARPGYLRDGSVIKTLR